MWLAVFTSVLAASICLSVGVVILQNTKLYDRWYRR